LEEIMAIDVQRCLTLSTLFACLFALIGTTHAAFDGTPGSKSALLNIEANAAAVTNASARSESSVESYRGHSTAEWTAYWWRWNTSIPLNVNPVIDSGLNCDINQDGAVWFLAGSAGGTGNFTRACTIAQGKAILAPVVAILNDYPCPDPSYQPAAGQTLEDFLTSGIGPLIDSFTLISATLDGKALKLHRVTSTVFGFTASADLKAMDPCLTGSPQLGVSDGYFVIIEPQSSGAHVLQISTSSSIFGATTGTFNLTIH
jgi:hypothetical protein